MADTVLVSLIGAQPMPNLRVARHLEAERHLFVVTPETEGVGRRLTKLVGGFVEYLPIEYPYDLLAVEEAILNKLEELACGDQVVFNLTGGTKTMSLAAFRCAEKLRRPAVYLESTRGGTIKNYNFASGSITPEGDEQISAETCLHEFILAHADEYCFCADLWHTSDRFKPMYEHHVRYERRHTEGNWFEDLVFQCLKESGEFDEILGGVRFSETQELDLMLRRGASVAFAELKTKKGAGTKAALDQLMGLAHVGFGIYTRKVHIASRAGVNEEPIHPNNIELAKQLGIEMVDLPSARPGESLDYHDRASLVCRVVAHMGKSG